MFNYEEIEDEHNRNVVKRHVEENEKICNAIIKVIEEYGTFVVPLKSEWEFKGLTDEFTSLALLFSKEEDVITVKFSHLRNIYLNI